MQNTSTNKPSELRLLFQEPTQALANEGVLSHQHFTMRAQRNTGFMISNEDGGEFNTEFPAFASSQHCPRTQPGLWGTPPRVSGKNIKDLLLMNQLYLQTDKILRLPRTPIDLDHFCMI